MPSPPCGRCHTRNSWRHFRRVKKVARSEGLRTCGRARVSEASVGRLHVSGTRQLHRNENRTLRTLRVCVVQVRTCSDDTVTNDTSVQGKKCHKWRAPAAGLRAEPHTFEEVETGVPVHGRQFHASMATGHTFLGGGA